MKALASNRKSTNVSPIHLHSQDKRQRIALPEIDRSEEPTRKVWEIDQWTQSEQLGFFLGCLGLVVALLAIGL